MPKLLGSSGKHMSVSVCRSTESRFGRSAFGNAEEWLPHFEQLTSPIDVVFRPVINEFNGYREVQMQLIDWAANSNLGSRSRI